jgi:hypothetical protein
MITVPVTIKGPYTKASYPYDQAVLPRDDFYVYWSNRCVRITQFADQPNRWFVPNYYPIIEASTALELIEKIINTTQTPCT